MLSGNLAAILTFSCGMRNAAFIDQPAELADFAKLRFPGLGNAKSPAKGAEWAWIDFGFGGRILSCDLQVMVGEDEELPRRRKRSFRARDAGCRYLLVCMIWLRGPDCTETCMKIRFLLPKRKQEFLASQLRSRAPPSAL
ncbi:hypothetical protein LL06_08760 [Hoeflea sp. BAL378]|nr:hypothetical protein LL06_08760 [Hoeflea sp. BAL378]